MNITFSCPECEHSSRVRWDEARTEIACPACAWRRPTESRVESESPLRECLVCGCRELYVRKNFSQQVGVGIVVLAAIASSITWALHMQLATYGILFAAALLDLVLYFWVGNLLQCYRCHAEYRGMGGLEGHDPFSLETHERYRQQAIRLAEAQASQPKGA